jgi:hypothetical protein
VFINRINIYFEVTKEEGISIGDGVEYVYFSEGTVEEGSVRRVKGSNSIGHEWWSNYIFPKVS